MPLIGSPLMPADTRPRIVAIGFKRIHQMLQALVPELADRAAVEVLDAGFGEAVAQVRQRQAMQAVDVVVAAGSNGGYLRQHLELPVVLVKVGASMCCRPWPRRGSALSVSAWSPGRGRRWT